MLIAHEFVWTERGDGWFVGLVDTGELHIELSEGWTADPRNLRLQLPDGAHDAIIKHEGETRRFRAILLDMKDRA